MDDSTEAFRDDVTPPPGGPPAHQLDAGQYPSWAIQFNDCLLKLAYFATLPITELNDILNAYTNGLRVAVTSCPRTFLQQDFPEMYRVTPMLEHCFEQLAPSLLDMEESCSWPTMHFIEVLTFFSEDWCAYFLESAPIVDHLSRFICCESRQWRHTAIRVQEQIWIHALLQSSTAAHKIVERFATFSCAEEAHVPDLTRMLCRMLEWMPGIMLPDDSIVDIICPWLCGCFGRFPTYRVMSGLVKALYIILQHMPHTHRSILDHHVICGFLGMVNKLDGFPGARPPPGLFILITKIVQLVGVDEGVALLKQISTASYLALLAASPAFLAHSCLTMVSIFILYDQEAASFFGEGNLFMDLSCNFDHERGMLAEETAWLAFCHALMFQAPDSAIHLLIADGTIRKEGFFVHPDTVRVAGYQFTSLYLHLVCLMIDAAAGTEVEEAVAQPLLEQAVAMIPFIEGLISEHIMVSLPFPIGEISISELGEHIIQFVLAWDPISTETPAQMEGMDWP
jgi:hypothetical protein